MQQKEAKWNTLRTFIDGYFKADTNYRAGAIYEAYLNGGGTSVITRKDFEMFLRDQVIKDDGLLKRVSHGVYAIRNNPDDKGVFFPRNGAEKNTVPKEISLDEILDDSFDLLSKMRHVFNKLEKLDGISFPAQMELKSFKTSFNKSMDTAITGISAVMAWCEDNVYIEPQSETETI